jgi:hypothetical protein
LLRALLLNLAAQRIRKVMVKVGRRHGAIAVNVCEAGRESVDQMAREQGRRRGAFDILALKCILHLIGRRNHDATTTFSEDLTGTNGIAALELVSPRKGTAEARIEQHDLPPRVAA